MQMEGLGWGDKKDTIGTIEGFLTCTQRLGKYLIS